MRFVDDDGSIIVPKSVRPIIEYSPTTLGSGSGALRQFRAGKLHIREYEGYYSVHLDAIFPIFTGSEPDRASFLIYIP